METWIDNSISINSIQYIDYNLIDQISVVNGVNKYREATKLTNHFFCGISLLKISSSSGKQMARQDTRFTTRYVFKLNTFNFNFHSIILTTYLNF